MTAWFGIGADWHSAYAPMTLWVHIVSWPAVGTADTPPSDARVSLDGSRSFSALLEDVAENDGVVVALVARAEHQCDPALCNPAGEAVQFVVVVIQLGAVTALELVPALGVVVEPAAEVVARCELPCPLVDLCVLLGDPARPDAVDEHTVAVVAGRLVVDASQPDSGAHDDIELSTPLRWRIEASVGSSTARRRSVDVDSMCQRIRTRAATGRPAMIASTMTR